MKLNWALHLCHFAYLLLSFLKKKTTFCLSSEPLWLPTFLLHSPKFSLISIISCHTIQKTKLPSAFWFLSTTRCNVILPLNNLKACYQQVLPSVIIMLYHRYLYFALAWSKNLSRDASIICTPNFQYLFSFPCSIHSLYSFINCHYLFFSIFDSLVSDTLFYFFFLISSNYF